MANERHEGGPVNFFAFLNVDRAAYVSVETLVEETGRILQRRAVGEGKLHDLLVGFASADVAAVRPNRSARPLTAAPNFRSANILCQHGGQALGDSWEEGLGTACTSAGFRSYASTISVAQQYATWTAPASRTPSL